MLLKINDYIKTARVWQWAKNFVVFTLPVGVGSLEADILIKVTIAFIRVFLNLFCDLCFKRFKGCKYRQITSS